MAHRRGVAADTLGLRRIKILFTRLTATVFSPRIAAKATFALNGPRWFRRARLAVASLLSRGTLAAFRQEIHLPPCPDSPGRLCGRDADIVFGGQDNDVAYGNIGDDILYGNLGDDTMFGGQGSDLLYGGQGNDFMLGGVSDDTLHGGRGDDTIHTGSGADLVVVQSNGGLDVIGDFDGAAGDRIQIAANPNGTAIDTFAELLAASADNADGHAVLVLGMVNTVTLTGVSTAQLQSGWFVFA